MTFLQVINSQCGDSKLQRKVSNHKLRLFYVMSILQSVSVQYDTVKVVDTRYSTNKVVVAKCIEYLVPTTLLTVVHCTNLCM